MRTRVSSFVPSICTSAVLATGLLLGGVAQGAPGMTKSKPGSSRPRVSPSAKGKRKPKSKTKSNAKPSATSTAKSSGIDIGKATAADLKKRLVVAKIRPPKLLLKPIDGIEIPPEPAMSWNGKFHLNYKGIAAKTLDDADDRDEVAVVVALLTATPTGYAREVSRVTGSSSAPVNTRGVQTMGAKQLFNDEHRDVLLFSAVIEVDDGDPGPALDQMDLLINQAIVAATKLRSDDEDPLDTLDAMIELAKFSLGSGATAPSVRTHKIQTWDWDRIIDQRAARRSRVPYRILIAHAVGAGRYNLLFDVPRPTNHKRRRLVKVDVRSLSLTTPADLVGTSGSTVSVCVGVFHDTHDGKPCATKEMSGKLNLASSWKPTLYYRWTRQANRRVNVAVEQFSKKYGKNRLMDLNPDGTKAVASHGVDVRDSPVHIDVTYQGENPHHAGRVHYLVDF